MKNLGFNLQNKIDSLKKSLREKTGNFVNMNMYLFWMAVAQYKDDEQRGNEREEKVLWCVWYIINIYGLS
jgi:Fe-S-cluster formation regulator IscX/YfhJ